MAQEILAVVTLSKSPAGTIGDNRVQRLVRSSFAN